MIFPSRDPPLILRHATFGEARRAGRACLQTSKDDSWCLHNHSAVREGDL
jgi:hypothetical protein